MVGDHRSHGTASAQSRTAPLHARQAGRRKLWTGVLIAAIVVFVAAACALGAVFFTYWQGQKSYDSLAESSFMPDSDVSDVEGSALSGLVVDWDALRAINPDVVAWVYIPGTNVNYPVVKAPADNPDKYLTTDFEGNVGGRWMPTYGTPYLLSSNASDFSDKNNIVQGHHLQNGEMFAALADFADSAQFNAHRNVYLLTPKGNYRLCSISLVHCEGSEPIAQTQFASDADFTAYVQDKIDRSVVSANPAAPSAQDVSQLFMFSTCDSNSDARYVLYCAPGEFAVAGSGSSTLLGAAAGQTNASEGGAGADVADPQAASNIDDAAKEIVS